MKQKIVLFLISLGFFLPVLNIDASTCQYANGSNCQGERSGEVDCQSATGENKNCQYVICIGNTLRFQPFPYAQPQVVTTNPQFGTLTFDNTNGGFWVYTPTVSSPRTDFIQIQYLQSTANITISIVNVLSLTAMGGIANTSQNTIFNGIVSASGGSGNYAFSLFSNPANGTLLGSPAINPVDGAFSYQPNLNFIGLDSFAFRATDTGACGCANSVIGQQFINVGTQIIYNAVITTCANTTTTQTILFDTVTNTFSILTPPSHGQISNITTTPTSLSYNYTPNLNYQGSDSFVFNVSGPNGFSSMGTVTIEVLSLLVANNVSVTGCAGSSITSDLSPSGGSGFYTTYSITQPSHGSAVFEFSSGSPAFVYSPTAGYTGPDSFNYTVVDSNGCLSNNTGTVNIFILSQPVGLPFSLSGCAGTSVNGQLVATGGSGNYIYAIQNAGSFPELTFFNPNTGMLTWDFTNSSTVTFNYSVQDVFGCNGVPSTGQMIPLSIPQTVPITFLTCQNGSHSGILTATGSVGPYNFTYNGPLHGVLNIFNPTSGQFAYTPNTGFIGTDNFAYQARDVSTGCVSAFSGAIITVNSTIAPAVPNFTLLGCLNGSINGNLTAMSGAPSYTYSYFNGPLHGVLSVFNTTNGQFVYQPNANYSGADSFNYYATDSNSCVSDIGTVNITIGSTASPVASAGTLTNCQNGAEQGSFSVTGGSGTYVNYTIVVPPTRGTVSDINATNGTYVYTSFPGVFGSDSFEYTVTDSNGCISNVALISITTLSTVAPIAQDSSLTVCENGSVNGLFNPTGFTGLFSIETLPAHGTVTHNGTSQNFIYAPNTGYVGADSFMFTVSNGICTSNLGTITINVVSSIAPTISTLSLAACQDGIVTATINPVGGTSPYLSLIQTQPNHGLAIGSGSFSLNPTVTYIPNSGYVGADSFVYQVEDSSSFNCVSLTGLANITVESPLAPVVQTVNVTSCQGNPVTGTLVASQGTVPYSFTYMDGPSHGTITLFNQVTGTFTYQPNLGYSGSDGFVYSAIDSTVPSSCQSFTASVGITVDPILTITPLSIGLCVNGVKQSQLSASGGTPPYSYAHLNNPTHGTLTQFNQLTGQFTYKPTLGFSGSDSFNAQVTDAVGCTNTITVAITVNTSVTAIPFSLTACAGGSIAGTFQAVGGSGSYTFAFSNPSSGFITPVGSNQFIYTPIAGFVGTDSFTYTATDAALGGCMSAPVTVTITVTGGPAPHVVPLSITTCFNVTASGTLLASGGVSPYTFSTFNGPLHGTLIPFNSSTGTFTYNPTPGFSGQDMFSYRVTDSAGCTSAAATVVITVDSSLAVSPLSLTTCMNTCKQGMFSATGGVGNYVFDITGGGMLQGEVFLGQGNTFTYCPPNGFVGTDSFNYFVIDALNCRGLDCTSPLGTVTVTVEFSQPVATPYTLTSCMNGSVTATFVATGGSGNYTFTYTNPSNGVVTLGNNNSFTYQPVPGFVGTDSFTYTAIDQTTGCMSNAVTVSITINSTPAPVALSLGITGCHGAGISGTYRPTGGSGTYTAFDLISGPSHGTVNPTSSAGPSFVYTSNATYIGSDSFSYTVEDSNGCVSELGTVGVTVDQVTANNLIIDASINATANGSLMGSSGIGSFTYSVNSPSTQGGTVTLTSGPTSPLFSYTPPLNFTGIDTFTYTVTDSFCTSSLGTVTVDVTSLAANNVSGSSCENTFIEIVSIAFPLHGSPVVTVTTFGMKTPIQIVLSGTGGEGCYQYNVPSSSTQGGSITQPYGNCAPYIIYTAPLVFTGTDSFTYTITDAQNITSSPATVIIQVISRPSGQSQNLTTCSNSIVNGTFLGSGGAGSGFVYSLTGTGPTHGVVELIPGTPQFQYNPTTGFTGTDGFGYIVTDANGCMGTGSVTVQVNQTPVANPVAVPACMNTQALSNFLPSGGTFPYVFNAPGFSNQGGIITQPGGTGLSGFTYTPPLNYMGPDNFTYTVTDANGCTSLPGVVSITVDAARATPLSITTCIDTPFAGNLAGVGGIGGYIFAFFNGPTHGTINPFNATTGAFTYNPTAGYTGPDSFFYNITDQTGAGCVSNTAEVSITVDGIVAPDENFTICIDTSLNGTLIAQGGIGTLTYTKVGPGPQPGNHLTLNPSGTFVFTPAPSFVGTDSFFYVATDSLSCNSLPAEVIIVVDQPTAENISFDACSNTDNNGVLIGSGGIGNYIYSTPQFSVEGGSIVNNGSSSFTYTPPTPTFSGSDSFTYTVLDSAHCVSDPGTVSISVNGPTASNLVFTGCPNKEVVGTLVATGGTGTFVTYQVVSGPNHGTFASFCQATGAFVYTPTINFVGTDLFMYTVTDSNNCTSNQGTVFINIQAPTAGPLTFTVCPNGSSNINLSLGVTGGTGVYVHYAIVGGPDAGTVTPVNPTAGQFLYTPFVGYQGPDNFLYTVTDSEGCVSNPGAVSVLFNQVMSIDSSFVDCTNTLLRGQALATGGTGIYTFGPIVIAPSHGTASITGSGSFTYQPTLNFTGFDSFTYQVSDSNGCSSLGTINITVGTPIGFNQNLTGCANVATTGFFFAEGGDGSYIFSITGAGPAHGTATVISPTGGSFIYNPTAGFTGSDSFQFGVIDTDGCTGTTGTISINVINNAIAESASLVTCQNVFIQGCVSVTGGAGTYINYSVVTPPAHGTLLSFCVTDGCFTYLPNNNFTGTDSFTYTVRDTNLCTSPVGTVTITVNALPIALTVIESLCSGASVTADLNPTGGSGSYVSYTVSPTSIQGGSVSQPMGNTSPEFTYISPSGLSGIDSFNYSVTDSNGCKSACGNVAIEVDSGPEGLGVIVSDIAGQTVGGQLQAVGGVPPYTFAIATLPTQGTASVGSSGIWSYTAFQTASGTDFFTFTVRDSSGCVATRRFSTRASAPDDTVIILITGAGYPFDIIPDACPL